MDKLYKKIRKVSFFAAMDILNIPEEAEDIAQDVCLKLINAKNDIIKKDAWARETARNSALHFLKEKEKIIFVSSEFLGNTYCENLSEECIEWILARAKQENNSQEKSGDALFDIQNITNREAKKLLTPEEYEYYRLMMKHNLNADSMAQELGKSPEYVYVINCRMKKNIAAAKLIAAGVREGKQIVSYNLHKNILKLQKKIKDYNDTGENRIIRKHFLNEDYLGILKIEIQRFTDYSFKIIEDNLFSSVFFYVDSTEKDCSFHLIFSLNRNEKIIVREIYWEDEK